ncbi:MFS transporter [Glycomyces sp. NRRL B-16210]|uniref:MFS transporter n=1 Tax=Glycomyces sp. NRRL B-16210 TaxID=1463821 RepID=UPI000ABC6A6E|nr:MFS transporter [Glycomyces sp. NRRL B-16210]
MSAEQASVRGHADFNRLWTGRAISQFGSDIGAVAIPLVAVTVLDASTLELSILAAVSAIAVAAFAFPLGTYVEFRAKRPMMIATDVIRFATVITIPAAALFDLLTFAQLCAVAVLNAVCQIAFASASQAHLRALVGTDQLVDAIGRLESTTWASLTVGRSLGGVIIAAVTATGALVFNACSFLLSAFAISRIRTPEPAPPQRRPKEPKLRQVLGGLDFVRHDRPLRRILLNWIVFAGASGMAFPISTAFYLRDLGFSAWEYGLLMGVPSIGGFIGARLVRRAVGRFGPIRTLWITGVLRGPWYFLIAASMPGTLGLVLCGLAFGAMLFFTSIANSAMTSYRQLRTPESLQARVATLWSFATTVSQPVFMLIGGVVATWTGNRAALVIAAAVMTLAVLLLPRTSDLHGSVNDREDCGREHRMK